MGTSNLDRLIDSFPHSNIDHRKLSDIPHHQCDSSTSQTPISININNQEAGETNVNLAPATLKIQVSSSAAEFKFNNGEDEPKTPRAMDHRIPVMVGCPPAPRKAKWVTTTGKRRASCFPVVRVPDDFVAYLDAMLALNETVFVPDIVVGDLGAGDRVKRLKLLTSSAHEG